MELDRKQPRVISIHALREEGDPSSLAAISAFENFYPRPPRGGRLLQELLQCPLIVISIHALREEGDALLAGGYKRLRKFLSTPSARRATPKSANAALDFLNFYPRPPRGGRRASLYSS